MKKFKIITDSACDLNKKWRDENDVAYAKASDEFTLPTQNDFLASSIPLFRTLKGFAYDKDATNVDFKPGAVADLSKSDTLYAIWSIDPNTIFDFTDGSTFNYGVVSGKGMSVRADFINAGKTAIAVGDQVKVYYGTADNYQTITTEINGIEGYEGDDVTYYIGDSDGKEIVIYLNNIGDDVMSACLGVELVTVHDNLVISVATITGRGTLIEVKLSEDVEVGNTVDVLSNAYDGKVLNDTPIVSIYRDGAVIVNASAGETVGLLLRGVSKDDIPVGTMFWHDLP